MTCGGRLMLCTLVRLVLVLDPWAWGQIGGGHRPYGWLIVHVLFFLTDVPYVYATDRLDILMRDRIVALIGTTGPTVDVRLRASVIMRNGYGSQALSSLGLCLHAYGTSCRKRSPGFEAMVSCHRERIRVVESGV